MSQRSSQPSDGNEADSSEIEDDGIESNRASSVDVNESLSQAMSQISLRAPPATHGTESRSNTSNSISAS